MAGELKFVGLEGLEDVALEREITSLAERHQGKLAYLVHNEFETVVHIKRYRKAGERQKFSVHLKVSWPGGTVASSKDDWFLPNAAKSAFEAAEQQLRSKFGSGGERT